MLESWNCANYPRVVTASTALPALRALGELNRMRILRLLLSRAWSVNEIADQLSMSQYNVSKHLKILREAGLVETEKQGKQRFYAVARISNPPEREPERPRIGVLLVSGSTSCPGRFPCRGRRNSRITLALFLYVCQYAHIN